MNYSYLVTDCSALIYADAYAIKGLRTDEIATNVIFGFLNHLLNISEKFKTNKFAFCWDGKGSKREEIFPEYKAKRKERKKNGTPKEKEFFESVIAQAIRLQKDILPHIGFANNFQQNGYEADDIMADLVIGYENCLMITGDEDLYQMLGYADLYKPKTETILTIQKFEKSYGINPRDWVNVKAIGGCTSDEVPGIPGVAEKNAIKYLLGKMNTATDTYKNIVTGTEIIKRNLKLVTLPYPGTNEFEIKKDHFDINGLRDVAKEYWIDSYLTKSGITRWENFFNRRELCLHA